LCATKVLNRGNSTYRILRTTGLYLIPH